MRWASVAALVMITSCATTPAAEIHPITAIPTGCGNPTHALRPDYGHNPQVNWRPEALKKVPPDYPTTARESNIDGTVWIAALVCEHGRVVEAHVTRSVPMLDAPALDCIRHWEFRPAHTGTEFYPYWVDVPI